LCFQAALKVAAAPPGKPKASCDDPSCSVDHSHGAHEHDHGHSHGHAEEEAPKFAGVRADGSAFTPLALKARSFSHIGAQVAITAEFDSGNIICEDASDPSGIGVQLRIRPDVYTELEKKAHSQWFYFKATGVSDGAVEGHPATKFVITKAKHCSFPDAWPGTTVCASLDRTNWFRCLDTVYDDAAGTISWSFAAASHPGAHADASTSRVVWFAFFAPYSWERHMDHLASIAASPFASVNVIGRTLDGRDLDLVKIGDGPRKVRKKARLLLVEL